MRFRLIVGNRNYYLLLLLSLLTSGCHQATNIDCTGIIKGTIIYSGEGIPSDLIVVATDTITKRNYSTKEHEENKTDNNFHFTLKAPNGVYFVYAETNDFVDTSHKVTAQKAYYTEYMKLQKYKSQGDASHDPIAVKVPCNDTVKNIIVGDFWK